MTTPVTTDGLRAKHPIRRALVSVYDKTGLAELAHGLHEAGIEIVSTGSTAARIRESGVPVTSVEQLTGLPECLDGRVKTLHPKVHAGLLADTRDPAHLHWLAEAGIEPFELLVGNLYPFRETVARLGCSAYSGAGFDECVEQIDIGGPAMIRAAAKNHPSVSVVVDPARYPDVVAAARDGGFELEARRVLAAAAFAHTAAYDVAVASWFAETGPGTGPGTGSEWPGSQAVPWPAFTGTTFELADTLRYGENPHQAAALYVNPSGPPGLARAVKLHGKPMSYNNYVDTDAARRAAYDFDAACVAVVKHANPCGIAISVAGDIAEAHRKAHACDPVSAFGGVIATNRPVTLAMAEQVAEIFTEVVCAPDFAPGAVELLAAKKNLRLLRCPPPAAGSRREIRQISGGVLVQTVDLLDAPGDQPSGWTLAAGDVADESTLADLEFAWRAARAVKSNAILLAAEGATVGVGMGQVNRVDAAALAVLRAGERARGSVAASDAFFPFADGLEVLAEAGVLAVVQPGGSVRDDEVVAAAKAAGVTLYLTGTRHFSH